MALDFNLVSDFTAIHRRPFEMAVPALLDPTNANPLVMGEWLELNSSYQMARGTVNGATVPSYAVFSERGRFEVQAIGKVPMLYLNEYEADTKIFDGTGLTLGAALMVNDVVIGGLTKRGLKLLAGGAYAVGRVTRLPANNKGFLRFHTVRG